MKNTLLIMLGIVLLMQLIQVEKTNPQLDPALEIKAPEHIQTMFERSCYDCHANTTVWPWYSHVAPMSWIIQGRVVEGRKALDFTAWESYSEEEKKKHLKGIYRTVYAAMPLASYVQFHEEAELTKEQREEIRSWTGVRPW